MTEYYFDNKRPKKPVRRVISEIMHDPAVEYEGELTETDWRNVKKTEKPL